ncbi:MAG: PspC domain-containing protein [Chloroflexi bacterium]|nr:PspC domain-containing protein [Chloroflexota bacterium]
MNDIKRLERSRTDRMISGVCGGIARQFNLDTVIVRVFFVVIALINPGIAAIAYVAAIFLIPEESETGAANTAHPDWRYDPWTGETLTSQAPTSPKPTEPPQITEQTHTSRATDTPPNREG